jgi:excisionase family DNA binding protein
VKKKPLPVFFTIEDVADALGVSPKTVSRRIMAGDLRCHRFGRQVRVSEEDFRSYVALQRG